jgi:hypothetical protein
LLSLSIAVAKVGVFFESAIAVINFFSRLLVCVYFLFSYLGSCKK